MSGSNEGITLSRAEWAAVQKRLQDAETHRQVAERAAQIWADPALSNEAKALWKKKYPNDQIPDYDIRTEVTSQLAKDREEREKREKEAADKSADDAYKKARSETQSKYKFTDEGMKRIEALMVEKNIGDYDVAAHYFASQNPEPSGEEDGGSGASSLYDTKERQENFKKIAADPEGWALGELTTAVRADARARGLR